MRRATWPPRGERSWSWPRPPVQGGYERGSDLDEHAWQALLETAREAERLARAQGLVLALHPHYGTVVEGAAQVTRLLESSSVRLCLDVGHLAVGGADPLEVARRANGRVAHVHLKDVDAGLARRVRDGALGYRDAVKAGLYTALGKGSARIGEIVRLLEDGGYAGWYVLGAGPGAGRGARARHRPLRERRAQPRVPAEPGRVTARGRRHEASVG